MDLGSDKLWQHMNGAELMYTDQYSIMECRVKAWDDMKLTTIHIFFVRYVCHWLKLIKLVNLIASEIIITLQWDEIQLITNKTKNISYRHINITTVPLCSVNFTDTTFIKCYNDKTPFEELYSF